MREPWLTVILTVAALITAGGAIASYKILEGEPRYAEVIQVRPVVETLETPREVCAHESVSAKSGKQAIVLAGADVRAMLPRNARENCRTVIEAQETTVAYDVSYRIQGAERVIRMDHDPGPRLKLLHGTPDVE